MIMNSREQERKLTLDHMIDEKFGEIFFIAKEEFDIASNTVEEQMLFDMLERFREVLKRKCRYHFAADLELNKITFDSKMEEMKKYPHQDNHMD